MILRYDFDFDEWGGESRLSFEGRRGRSSLNRAVDHPELNLVTIIFFYFGCKSYYL